MAEINSPQSCDVILIFDYFNWFSWILFCSFFFRHFPSTSDFWLNKKDLALKFLIIFKMRCYYIRAAAFDSEARIAVPPEQPFVLITALIWKWFFSQGFIALQSKNTHLCLVRAKELLLQPECKALKAHQFSIKNESFCLPIDWFDPVVMTHRVVDVWTWSAFSCSIHDCWYKLTKGPKSKFRMTRVVQ